jgi:hypothetical protein
LSSDKRANANSELGIDEGELKNKTEEAKVEILETLSLMSSSPTPYSREGQPVRYVFDLIWQRFAKVWKKSFICHFQLRFTC